MPDTTLEITPEFMPPGWPVIAPDLLLAYLGSMLVVRIGSGISGDAFLRYRDEWTRSVDLRPAHASIFAMYDLPDWPGLTAEQRRQWGEMLKSREDVLKRTTRGVVIASPSSVARGGLRAILELAPPSYPYAVVETPRAAFEHIAERAERETFSAEQASSAYEELLRSRWVAAEG
jgi:hypothetical protein